MKKIALILLILTMAVTPAYGADQWTKASPAGTTNISDIDTTITVNNAALDRLVFGYRVDATVLYSSTTAVTVRVGELAIPNSDGSVVRWRRNTSALNLTNANLDTGAAFTNSTYHYVYAVADTDATTFTGVISMSDSAPDGATYYRKIGWFYVNASTRILTVGNILGGDVSNIAYVTGTDDISTTSTSYADMDDMIVYFVSSGRPIKVRYDGAIQHSGSYSMLAIDIDGTDVKETEWHQDTSGPQVEPYQLLYTGLLAAGTHTIKVQWKKPGGTTAYQNATTDGIRLLSVEEV
jgi:hypothetical protein